MYIDILTKFNTETMTGYALRFIRTTKFHDAVDCVLLQYKNGSITEISVPISTSCFRTPCYISIEVTGNQLTAKAKNSTENTKAFNVSEVVPEVFLKTTIEPNDWGGFGIRYNGGTATMINELKAEWN
jgi:hypothetical protein